MPSDVPHLFTVPVIFGELESTSSTRSSSRLAPREKVMGEGEVVDTEIWGMA